MPEGTMNDLIRAASRRNVVATTEPEPAVTRQAAVADAGNGAPGGDANQEQQARDHPVNVAVRHAFRGKG